MLVYRKHIGGHVRVHASTGLLRPQRHSNVYRRRHVLLVYSYF